MHGKTYDVTSIDVLTELNWKSLKFHFKSKKASFMHKVHNNAGKQGPVVSSPFSLNGG
jgi:hypothetical protein